VEGEIPEEGDAGAIGRVRGQPKDPQLKIMFRLLRQWLRRSSRVHIRETNIENLRDLVDLIDRFADDKLAYPLEWDDFISWAHSNPNIEGIRVKIASGEPLAFSKNHDDRNKFVDLITNERNRIAALCGIPAREPKYVQLRRFP
jgi:hypothetical protein